MMPQATNRRRFLKSTAPLAALAAFGPRLLMATERKTAVAFPMLPSELTVLERFRLAANAGFSGIEMRTVESPSEAEQVRDAADRTGLRIHSVVNDPHRRFPLSSADPEIVRRGVAGLETSLRNAQLWGADTVSITPAAAGQDTTYQDACNRSEQIIRERALPLAKDSGVVLAVDGVWDGFVLGPLEIARYVDAFDSPHIKACFDTGQVVFYARSQDWIRTLGSRLVNVRVRSIPALTEIAYDGWVTADIAGADPASLGRIHS